MPSLAGHLVALLLYLLVWPRLPAWLRTGLWLLAVALLAALLLGLFRMGFVAALGEAVTGIGHSLWQLLMQLGPLLIYAFTGH